jgi:hypothetical protein
MAGSARAARRIGSMIVPIPDDVQQEAWRLYAWVGESYGRISKLTGIPQTTVFNLLTGSAKRSPDYPLMRALARNLRKRGTDPHEYAAGIRIHTLLNKHGIDPIDADTLIQELLAEFYKAKWTPSEGISNLRRFSENAGVFGNSPAEHAAYVNKVLRALNDVKAQVVKKQRDLADIVHTEEIVKKNLEVFTTEGGVILSDVTERLAASALKEEIKNLKKELALYRSGQSVDKDELQKLNEQLIVPTTEQGVLDISNNVRLNPSRYPELFQTGIPRLTMNFKPFQDVPSLDHIEDPYEQKGYNKSKPASYDGII